MNQRIAALLTTGGIALAPSLSHATPSMNTLDQLITPSTQSGSLPQQNNPLDKFNEANETFQSFNINDVNEINRQLIKYSLDWISQLPNKSMQAEAYHQFAFTTGTKLYASVARDCVAESRAKGGNGGFCGDSYSVNLRIRNMASKNQVPLEYKSLAADAKALSDSAIAIAPGNDRYASLNKLVTGMINVISGR